MKCKLYCCGKTWLNMTDHCRFSHFPKDNFMMIISGASVSFTRMSVFFLRKINLGNVVHKLFTFNWRKCLCTQLGLTLMSSFSFYVIHGKLLSRQCVMYDMWTYFTKMTKRNADIDIFYCWKVKVTSIWSILNAVFLLISILIIFKFLCESFLFYSKF